jgi:hypothetical protein
MERIRYGRYIENMTSVTTMVEAMHGAGSPQAQRIVMLGQAAIDAKSAWRTRCSTAPTMSPVLLRPSPRQQPSSRADEDRPPKAQEEQ